MYNVLIIATIINNINISLLSNDSSFIADIIDSAQNTENAISNIKTTAVLIIKINFDLLIPNIPLATLFPLRLKMLY